MTKDEIYDIIMDYQKSNELGEYIMNDMFKYLDNIINDEGKRLNGEQISMRK